MARDVGESYNAFAVPLGQDATEDRILINRLLRQIKEMKSVERLNEGCESIAGILKSNFKIEELF